MKSRRAPSERCSANDKPKPIRPNQPLVQHLSGCLNASVLYQPTRLIVSYNEPRNILGRFSLSLIIMLSFFSFFLSFPFFFPLSRFFPFVQMLAETNPIVLGITMVVSILHSVFNFLAFKNDISFWKDKKRSVNQVKSRSPSVSCVDEFRSCLACFVGELVNLFGVFILGVFCLCTRWCWCWCVGVVVGKLRLFVCLLYYGCWRILLCVLVVLVLVWVNCVCSCVCYITAVGVFYCAFCWCVFCWYAAFVRVFVVVRLLV